MSQLSKKEIEQILKQMDKDADDQIAAGIAFKSQILKLRILLKEAIGKTVQGETDEKTRRYERFFIRNADIVLNPDRPVPQKYVLQEVLRSEADKYTLKQLEDRYSRNKIKWIAYGAVLSAGKFASIPLRMQEDKYSNSKPIVTKDGFDFYILKGWSIKQNRDEYNRGNFWYLTELLNAYGYSLEGTRDW